ncbi:MAG TPA: antibiotic biosynthesis monooxygenase [Candidatus Baltobacteraceae bacterium]|nr:antibiotic biosynthesis monooxygenase [Candidatus Baltobacteraceae bacterium]
MNEENGIIAVVTFEVTPEAFGRVSSEAASVLQGRLPAIAGFIEGMVLANESTTEVRIVTRWTSREHWAAAQWDERIERTVTDLFQDTASYKLEMYALLATATSANDAGAGFDV